MQMGTILTHARTDIVMLAPGQTASGQPFVNTLFVYTGEVACKFVSPNNTTLNDQLGIVLPDADLGTNQFLTPAIPIIVPTSWNVNDNFAVIAVNNPAVTLNGPQALTGLMLTTNVAVQNGMLLNVQYKLSVLVATTR
jgi:hypothetical protein